MSYVVRILVALVLGLYSTVGLHYYSVLISRTKNEWIRIVYFIAAIVVFIFLPMICAFLLVPNPTPASLGMQRLWFGAVMMVWLSVIWIYLIKNWKPLKARLCPKT